MQYFKKSLALLLAVLMLLSTLTLVSFAENDTTEPSTPSLHEHEYDYSHVDIEPLAPTCTTAGHGKGWKCKICGEVNWEAGDYAALGHKRVPIEAVAATCTTAGSTAGEKCERCDEILKAPEPVNALGHSFGPWVTVREAKGCGEEGERQRRCTRTGCNELEYERFTADSHKMVPTGEKKPTCTEAGYEAYWTCSVCKKMFSDAEGNNQIFTPVVIKATGHNYDKDPDVAAVEPTCTKDGHGKGWTCKNAGCGQIKWEDGKEKINALGHDYVIDEAVAPTCKEDGKTEGKHCARCKEVFIKQEVVPKDEKYHEWEIIPAVAATCTEKGSSEGKKCKICGKVESEAKEIKAKGHSFTTDVITQVSCEDNGLVKKFCTECNVSETIVVPATGHKFGDWTYSENFSCENGGERWQVCENCGKIFNREQVPAAGHKWSEEWTIDTPATCTSRGYKSHHCTVCDKKNDITTIAKVAHKYDDTVVKATTKKSGLVTGVCTVCGLERKPITVKRVKSFALSKTSYTYDGKAKKPTVVVKNVDGKKLKNGTDYKVTYASGRKKVGTYTVKIKLMGYYSGSKTLKFTIKLATPKGLEAKTNAAKKTIKLSCSAVKGAKQYVIYYATEKNGSYKKLAATKKTAYNITTLKPGTYYFKVRALTLNTAGKNSYSAYSNALKVKLAKAK